MASPLGAWSHRLRPNHGRATLHGLFVLDTEARIEHPDPDTEVQTLRLGVCAHWRTRGAGREPVPSSIVFRDPAVLWDWVTARCRPGTVSWLVAHNLGYDARTTALPYHLAIRGWSLDYAVLEDPPFVLRWSRQQSGGKPARLLCVSITNYTMAPLADLARAVGLEKLEVDFEAVSDLELVAYCGRDLEILHRWMLAWVRFVRDRDLGRLSPTVSGQAMNAYRHRYLKTPIVPHRNVEITELERRAYYGGRVECLRLGDLSGETWERWDVNSLYPAMMRRFPYPSELIGYRREGTVAQLEHLLHRYCVVAEVELETQEDWYPVRDDLGTLFPVGRFATTLTTRELIRAVRHGEVRRVGAIAWYRPALLFRDYVDDLYRQRIEARRRGDLLEASLWKALLLGLYGKFGQYGHHQVVEDDCDPRLFERIQCYRYETGEPYLKYFIGGKVIRDELVPHSSVTFVAIAAHVAADGRLYLRAVQERVGRDQVAYSDTDSLIVRAGAVERAGLATGPDELGALKLEEVSDLLVVVGAKWYRHGRFLRQKGIPEEVRSTDPGDYPVRQWRSFSAALTRGEVDRVVVRRVWMRYAREYRKGVLLPDGRVRPLRLPEEAELRAVRPPPPRA